MENISSRKEIRIDGSLINHLGGIQFLEVDKVQTPKHVEYYVDLEGKRWFYENTIESITFPKRRRILQLYNSSIKEVNPEIPRAYVSGAVVSRLNLNFPERIKIHDNNLGIWVGVAPEQDYQQLMLAGIGSWIWSRNKGEFIIKFD